MLRRESIADPNNSFDIVPTILPHQSAPGLEFTGMTNRFFPPIKILHPQPLHRFDARTRGRSPVPPAGPDIDSILCTWTSLNGK